MVILVRSLHILADSLGPDVQIGKTERMAVVVPKTNISML